MICCILFIMCDHSQWATLEHVTNLLAAVLTVILINTINLIVNDHCYYRLKISSFLILHTWNLGRIHFEINIWSDMVVKLLKHCHGRRQLSTGPKRTRSASADLSSSRPSALIGRMQTSSPDSCSWITSLMLVPWSSSSNVVL